jgi:hypothetical protein
MILPGNLKPDSLHRLTIAWLIRFKAAGRFKKQKRLREMTLAGKQDPEIIPHLGGSWIEGHGLLKLLYRRCQHSLPHEHDTQEFMGSAPIVMRF